MAVNLKSIAAAAGVSINTVSDIVNRGRSHLYDPKTAEKVRKIALRLNYKPNRSAQALRSRKSRIVGFVAWNSGPGNTVSNSVVYPFIVGASHQLIRQGYHLATVELEELEWLAHSEVPKALDQQFFDALILQQGLWHHIERWGSKLGAPVLFWDAGRKEPHGCITRDEKNVGSRLVQELAALGHQRIAYHWTEDNWARYNKVLSLHGKKRRDGSISINPQAWLEPCDDASTLLHFSFFERYEGYQQAIKDLGLTPIDLVGSHPRTIAEKIKKLAPSAIVILGGRHWSRLLRGCFLAGKDVPDDISLASQDVDPRIVFQTDLEAGGMLYDRYDAGVQAAHLALQMISGINPASITLQSPFRMGETIAPAPR